MNVFKTTYTNAKDKLISFSHIFDHSLCLMDPSLFFFLSTAILNDGDPSGPFNQPAYKRPSRHLYFKARCLMSKRLLSSAPLREEKVKKKKKRKRLHSLLNITQMAESDWVPRGALTQRAAALYTLFEKRTTSPCLHPLTPPVANCAQSVSFSVGVG